MKAYTLKEPGGIDQLVLTDLPVPTPGENEVLVSVKAISINPVDVKTRSGKGVYGRIKNENPIIIGWDVSGTVEKSNSPLFSPGDDVFGMINFPGHGKAYAQYLVAPASQISLKPENISHDEAAASPLVGLTAWQALVNNANVKKGQRVLIHAASGGVGHVAVQLAKHLGAHVTGTSSAKNRKFVIALGADAHIDYRDYNWNVHGREFDFVLDAVGGDTFENSIKITRDGGTIISIPTGLTKTVAEKARAAGVNGYFMLVKSDGSDTHSLANLLTQKQVRMHVSQVFPFEDLAEAHLQVESGRTLGKVVVAI